MNLCIRCNPVSELLTDEAGELYCRYHGTNYILEVRADPAEAAPEVVEVPVPDVPETQ